jgi:hypothetical protein
MYPAMGPAAAAPVATEIGSEAPARLNASGEGVGGARGIGGRCWIGVKRVSSMGLIGGTGEKEEFVAEEVPAMFLSLSSDTKKDCRIVCWIANELRGARFSTWRS